jgi:hypothetical protein
MRTSCHTSELRESPGNQLRVAVAEARDSSRTQKKGTVHLWELLLSSTVKTDSEHY